MGNNRTTEQTIAGATLIVLGGLFLLGQITGYGFFGISWTLFVLIPGVIFLAIALGSKDDKTVGFIFPGTIVTGTGLILTYQNLTGHWESWAYIWALYPVFVGLSMWYTGYRLNRPEPVKVGRMIALNGMIGLVALGTLFELFIFGDMSLSLVTPLIPVLMIGAGLFIIFRSQLSGKSKRKSHDY